MKIYLGTIYSKDKIHYFYDNRKGHVYVIVDLRIHGVKRQYYCVDINGQYIGMVKYVRFAHLLSKPLHVVSSFEDVQLVIEKLILDKI